MERLAQLDAALIPAGQQSAALSLTDALPATAYLTLVSSVRGLSALEKGWRALEENASTPVNVFQSYAWIKTWCDVYIGTESDQQLHLLAGYDKGNLVFVWPLMIHRKYGVRLLSWLTEPFGQYGDVICARDQCPRLWVSTSLAYLKRLKGFDILRLRHVRADSTLATVAESTLIDANLHERAPWLDLTQFGTEADYESRYSSTQRKRRKKIRKHLEELGPVSFSELKPGSDCDRAIEKALAEKNKWLSERGRINRVMGCPGHSRFLRMLCRSGMKGFDPVVTEMKAGDRPVSWEIGFRSAGKHFAYITSHVNELTDLSPGRLHMDLSQRACLKAGMTAFDLMVPYDAHKESWSSACMDTRDYFLPFTVWGSITGHFVLRVLRPALRSMYYRAPRWLLRVLTGSRQAASEN